jgi:[ribosomal protein S18]-alanine N-acetyltransferase
MTLPDGFRIRSMVGQDLDAVIAIERENDSAPHWSISDYLVLIQSDSDLYLNRNTMVAEIACEVAGFAIVRLVATEAELESIVVAARWRGRGVGRLLLSESARQAKELGATRLDLEVRASNAAAIRLYRGAGFVETGRRRGYYRDPEEDAVLMSVIL